MHILQPKHSKLNQKEVEQLLNQYNISVSQLPKIKKEDPCLPENCEEGDVIKIERKEEEEEIITYHRVVI